LVALGELLDAGHEPRRLTEDLLATVRDAFLLTSARGRVRVDAPEDDQVALGALGEQLGAGMLVRTLETLGEAVVDMRGTDAADPRLVLEIALVRLARREAGTPMQALADRIDRLERGTGAGATPRPAAPTSAPAGAPAAGPGPATEAASGRPARSFAELRRERAAADPQLPEPDSAPAPPPVGEAPTAADEPEPAPAPAPEGDVDIDDVKVAWADILPELPPATRAAVREAQPLSVADGVITFGVPTAHYETALPRFKKEADNIRAALSTKLGRRMMFKPVAHDGFAADTPVASSAPDEEPPDDDEMLDITDLVDDATAAPAVDSVSLITQSLGATVVEEVPRD